MNDNEPNPWQSLSSATERLLGNLNKEKPDNGESQTKPGDANEKQREEYVEHRLREIRRWERRVRGRQD